MRVTVLIMILTAALVTACRPSMNTFPNDENGDVLRRMQADGDDLAKPRGIEFQFVFPTEQKAQDLQSRCEALKN